MNAFSVMGPNAASWKPVEGKHASIFGVDESFNNAGGNGNSSIAATGADVTSAGSGGNMLLNADLAAATNALRNVTITKVFMPARACVLCVQSFTHCFKTRRPRCCRATTRLGSPWA